MSNTRQQAVEYVIVGAGPAAITAIANLLNTGTNGKDIMWIDPKFNVGAFGTVLSIGSSVPGNTSVENYQKVNTAIYKIMANESEARPTFALDQLAPQVVCTLKTAAEPLQFITNQLLRQVNSILGMVLNMDTTEQGLTLNIKTNAGETIFITAKRVILATGAEAKTLSLSNVTLIDPNTVFIESELAKYLANNPGIKKVAVIGSSHSAALATMHLLKAGLQVKQFMNKEYKFATPTETANGVKYTQYDNTGLKGEVAAFTKTLLATKPENWEVHKADNDAYLQAMADCTHAVVAIGYATLQSLQVNRAPLSRLTHDSKTTAFKEVAGLFGIGVGFPQQVTAISGEVEFAVGVGKFWTTTSDPAVLKTWKENVAQTKSPIKSETQRFFYHAEVKEESATPSVVINP